MNEFMFSYLVGGALVPALLAFAATYYHKKGTPFIRVTAQRRLLAAVIIYVVCLGTELLLTLILSLAATANPDEYESPFLILSDLLGYFAGKRVLAPRGARP
jgi:hypothetical protein